MAQRRMVARNIATSKKLSKVSVKSALLYTWMIPFLDDYGCFHAENYMIKRLVVPYREDFTPKIIDKLLRELADANLLRLYAIDGYNYLEVQQFDKFQSLKRDRKMNAEYPPPPCGYSNWKDDGIQGETKCPNQDEDEDEDEVEEEQQGKLPPLSPVFKAWENYTQGLVPALTADRLRRMVEWLDAEIRKHGLEGYNPAPQIVAEEIQRLGKKKPPPANPISYLEATVRNKLQEEIDGLEKR